jgi:hypothetical protein
MATRLVERRIPVPAGAARHEASVQLPQGAQILAVLQEGNEAKVLLRADPAMPDETRFFVIILGDERPAGALLSAREAGGTYLGSFQAYARVRGERRDVCHLFEVAAPG